MFNIEKFAQIPVMQSGHYVISPEFKWVHECISQSGYANLLVEYGSSSNIESALYNSISTSLQEQGYTLSSQDSLGIFSAILWCINHYDAIEDSYAYYLDEVTKGMALFSGEEITGVSCHGHYFTTVRVVGICRVTGMINCHARKQGSFRRWNFSIECHHPDIVSHITLKRSRSGEAKFSKPSCAPKEFNHKYLSDAA